MSNQTYLGRLRDRVRSTFGDTTSGSERTMDDRGRTSTTESTDAPGNLFQCSTCSAVYIASEKRVCPECETEVEQVRSTLACR